MSVHWAILARLAFTCVGRTVLTGEDSQRDVAVCISGSPRYFDTPIPQDVSDWPPDLQHIWSLFPLSVRRYFEQRLIASQYMLTAVDTIKDFLYPKLGVFDIFMFVPLIEGYNESKAAGVCSAFGPRAGNHSAHRIFCEWGRDRPLSSKRLGLDRWQMNMISLWSVHPFVPMVQQLLGHARCNRMIRVSEFRRRVKYSWILRLRADTIFFYPFPPEAWQILAQSSYNKYAVFIRSPKVTGGQLFGSEDMFGIGKPPIMHAFLDRAFDFARMVNNNVSGGKMPLWSSLVTGFSPEMYAKCWLKKYYGGHMREYDRMYFHVFRYPRDRAHVARWQNLASKQLPWPSYPTVDTYGVKFPVCP